MKVGKLAAVCDGRTLNVKVSPSSDWASPFVSLHEPGRVGTLETFYCQREPGDELNLNDIETGETAHRYAGDLPDAPQPLNTRIIVSDVEVVAGEFGADCALAINIVPSTNTPRWRESNNQYVNAIYEHPQHNENTAISKFIRHIALELSIANSPAIRPLTKLWLQRRSEASLRAFFERKTRYFLSTKREASTSGPISVAQESRMYIAYAVEASGNKSSKLHVKETLDLWDGLAKELANECNLTYADIAHALCNWPKVGGQLPFSRVAELVKAEAKSGVNYLIRWRAREDSPTTGILQIVSGAEIMDSTFTHLLSRNRGQKRRADICKFYVP